MSSGAVGDPAEKGPPAPRRQTAPAPDHAATALPLDKTAVTVRVSTLGGHERTLRIELQTAPFAPANVQELVRLTPGSVLAREIALACQASMGSTGDAPTPQADELEGIRLAPLRFLSLLNDDEKSPGYGDIYKCWHEVDVYAPAMEGSRDGGSPRDDGSRDDGRIDDGSPRDSELNSERERAYEGVRWVSDLIPLEVGEMDSEEFKLLELKIVVDHVGALLELKPAYVCSGLFL